MKKLDFFSNRHTVRSYNNSPLDIEDIEKMLEAAAHAPNTGNMQWYSVIITTEPELRQALAPTHFNQLSVMEAPAILTFCIDLRRFEHWCRLNNAVPGFENFQSFIAAIIDTSIVAQQFCTIAEINGLGTCYLGTTAYNAPDIARILNLPERVVPVITVAVGYPMGESYHAHRLPVKSIVHRQQFHDYSDEDIRDMYREQEEDELMQRFVKDNNKESLAQVFTDVRYPRESSEYFSKIYYDFLKDNRFFFPE